MGTDSDYYLELRFDDLDGISDIIIKVITPIHFEIEY